MENYLSKLFWLLIFGAFFFAQNSNAYFGARPMGMGGAFTAVADDANAPYWNPAGLALNPEVSITASTLLNNRNVFVGDNVGNLKMCYETEMNPFEWVVGVGAASMLALSGARYLSDQGILKKGWGREGEKTEREESMAEQVKGSEEVVSLKQKAKTAAKKALGGVGEFANQTLRHTFLNINVPLYTPDYYRPHYWEPRETGPSTKAQFALGLSWLNNNNPPLDQNSNWYTLTLASGFEQRVAVGANLNVYYLNKISTSISGLGGDVDLGVIAKPVSYISFGLTAKSLLTSDLTWQDGSTTRYEMLVNGGIAIKPVPPLTLAADVDNILWQNNKIPTYHYGVEAAILPGLIARAGLYDGSKTAGLSLAVANLVVDYAYLGGSFNRTQMVGAAWRF